MQESTSSDKPSRTKKDDYLIRYENHVWLWVAVVLIIALAACLVILPTKVVTSTEEVPYQAVEEYWGTEPYVVNATASVKVPVQDERCDYENPVYYIDTDTYVHGQSMEINCSITNLASLPVDFTYYAFTMNAEGEHVDRTNDRIVTVPSQDTVTTTTLLPTEDSGGCWVRPKILVDCQSIVTFREISKKETLVKQKNIIKTRTITRYRTDTIHKEVNWIFGVQFPWHNQWRVQGKADSYLPVG